MSFHSFPRELGRAGVTSFQRMAELAADKALSGRTYAVTIDLSRKVRMERVADACAPYIAATFTRGCDPDWLASEMRFAAEQRGMA